MQPCLVCSRDWARAAWAAGLLRARSLAFCHAACAAGRASSTNWALLAVTAALRNAPACAGGTSCEQVTRRLAKGALKAGLSVAGAPPKAAGARMENRMRSAMIALLCFRTCLRSSERRVSQRGNL